MRALRNIWYVAAWSGEIAPDALFSRILLNERILFFRDTQGQVQALADRCPHRFIPLHLGKLCGDAVQCAYHGLRFGGDGACVHNPQNPDLIPKAAKVRAYPIVERYSAVWIWMGEPEEADPATIPAFPAMDPETHAIGHGYLMARANYELESDNILDLSHIEYLHPMFASEAVARGKFESVQQGNTVWSRRFISDDQLPAFVEQAFGIPAGALADRWLDCRWEAPALLELITGATLAGRPRHEGREVPSAHFFTPETETTTHYWYSMSFPLAIGPQAQAMAEQATESLRAPFEMEDLPILEAQQREMGDAEFWSLRPVLLPGDAAGVRARRVLDGLITAEERRSA